MREIKVKDIALVVENLLIDACQNIPENVLNSLRLAKENEKSPLGQEVIQRIIDNDLLAREKCLPICQDFHPDNQFGFETIPKRHTRQIFYHYHLYYQ